MAKQISLGMSNVIRPWILLVVILAVPVGAGCTSEAEVSTVGGGVGSLPIRGDTIVLEGFVVAPRSRLDTEPIASIALHDAQGNVVWRAQRPVDSTGYFRFYRMHFPQQLGQQELFASVVAAEAPFYLAAQADVIVRYEEGELASVTPSQVFLRLAPYNPWLALIVLIPGFLGLVFAVFHLTQFALGHIGITYIYSFGAALLWGGVALWITWLYVSEGDVLIPLFWPDLFISSGIIIFTYIGSLVYAAYSLHDKGKGFFTEATRESQRAVLLALGGRILVAPYVALVAYGILAATFPVLRTGAFALFFGFFTGLFIKVVLEVLNDVGTRFLSVEARQRLVDRMAEQDEQVPPPPTADARFLRPTPDFVEAVAAARNAFLTKDGVIGVSARPAEDATGGMTQPTIVAYVYEKRDMAEDDPDRVPKMFMGFPIDVVPLPPVDPDEPCSSIMPQLSWPKIAQDIEAAHAQFPSAPSDPVAEQQGGLMLLHDPDATLFRTAKNVREVFDVVGAYRAVREDLGDHYDFVTFVIHKASRLPHVSNYSVAVANDVKGTNYDAPGNPGTHADRFAYGSRRLRACHVISASRPTSWLFLHELGHAWSAYVTFRDPLTGAECYDLLRGRADQDRFHWSECLDNGRSCMDYDRKEWVRQADGTYLRRPIKPDEFEYSKLDLYLMGLLPPEKVGDIELLRSRQEVKPDVYRATPMKIRIDAIIRSCGLREPPPRISPTVFSQAFVVVTRDMDSASEFIASVEAIRRDLPDYFKRATGGRGTLHTDLVPPA